MIFPRLSLSHEFFAKSEYILEFLFYFVCFMDFRGILVVCVHIEEVFNVIKYSRPSSSLVAFLFLFFFLLLAFVDKSFYFIELGSLSFRVIFAGLKYQRDHRCHGDVTRIIYFVS